MAAETTGDDEQQPALNEGFRRLAGYVFGDNHDGTSITKTAPLSRHPGDSLKGDGQQIDMTAPVVQYRAPVGQSRGSSGSRVTGFFMPSTWTMQTLPVPNDERVRLRLIPRQTVAVLRFSGERGDAAVGVRTEQRGNGAPVDVALA